MAGRGSILHSFITRPPEGAAHRRRVAHVALALALALLVHGASNAQQAGRPEPMQPGEAFVTRFSGIATTDGAAAIDVNGMVGSVVDLRNPSQPPQGQHWLNEPQRFAVTAGEAGQVFGVTLDDAASPNVYITATSAFGLHRSADNAGWMPGMWGPDGGPGSVWKVGPESGYKPRLFASIGVGGRANTGAALGNIAYDRWHKQLYVSDLETGLIHRLQLDNGSDLGTYDHGIIGRGAFVDAQTGEEKSLPAVRFDTGSAARVTNCTEGEFSRTPDCWNFADFRRRVWGLGVRQDPATREVRLYYAVWSSQALGSAEFAGAAEEEKRNSVWSVAITDSGGFNEISARREFFLPDFFIDPADVARAGRSNPVADIAFCRCEDQRLMLLAERGGVRNLGLGADSPFAYPHEARVLAYELDAKGNWQPKGRYDVGHYDRKDEGRPYLRANASGGADFGYGYGVEWHIDPRRPDETAWMTGGTLCTPGGPCFSPDIGRAEDGSYVGGAQGAPRGALEAMLPEAAAAPYPNEGAPYPDTGPLQSFVFDTDKNLDANDTVIMAELARNDASKIGDISIYELCDGEGAPEQVDDQPELVDEQPGLVDQPPEIVDPPVVVDTPPAADIPDLEVAKAGPAQCALNQVCPFTITVTNRGPGLWSGPVQLTDTLPPGANLVAFNPADWMCAQAGGIVNCTSAWVALNPGDVLVLTLGVAMPFGAAGPLDNCIAAAWLPGRDPDDPAVILALEQALNAAGNQVGVIDGVLDIVTQAGIRQLQANAGLPVTGVPDQAVIDLLFGGNAGMAADGNPGNDVSCATVTVPPPPALPPPPLAPPPVAGPAPGAAGGPAIQIQKIQTGACRPGGECAFDLWFVNRGTAPWVGVPEIVDTVPPGATLVAAASAAGCTQAGNTVTCRYPQRVTLPPNSPVLATVTLRMPADLPPGAENCAQLGPTLAGDPNAGDRQCIPVELANDLAAAKVQRTGRCRPGGLCAFELSFINRGPGPWTGVPELVDTLPEGASLVSTSGRALCRQSGRSLTCRNPQEVTLAPGGIGRVVVTVRLPRNAQASARNCVAIADTLAVGDADPENNRQCINVRVAPRPTPDIQALKIQTSEACAPGGSCSFDLWFINRGPGRHKGRPTLTDALPAGATFESASAPWTCKQSGQSLACSHAEASLPPGRGVKVSVTVRLPAGIAANARNCVRAIGHGRDPIPQNDEQCITIRTSAPPEAPEPPAPAHDPEPQEVEPHAPHEPSAPPADTRSEKQQLGPCKPGGSCLFELKFFNAGPGVWSGKAKLADILPDAETRIGSWTPSTWDCKQAVATIICEHSGATLQPGEHLSLNMTVRLPEHLHAGAQNCVVVERPDVGHVDPSMLGDRTCVTIDMAKPGFAPRPPPVVQPGQTCPHGTIKQAGQCAPINCPAGYELRGDKCFPVQQQLSCPAGYVLKGDQCHSTQLSCPAGYVLKGKKCYSTQLTCPKGYTLRGKKCYPPPQKLTCPKGYTLRGRLCYPPQQQRVCPPGYIKIGNLCIRPGGGPKPHQGGGGHGHH